MKPSDIVKNVIQPVVDKEGYLPYTAFNELCFGSEGSGKLHVAYLNEFYLEGAVASRSTWEKALREAKLPTRFKRGEPLGDYLDKDTFCAAYELNSFSNFRQYLKMARTSGYNLSMKDIAEYLNILQHSDITEDRMQLLSTEGLQTQFQ